MESLDKSLKDKSGVSNMPKVIRTITKVEEYETEITQEQYDLYEQSPDEFDKLFYNELQTEEELVHTESLDEYIEVSE